MITHNKVVGTVLPKEQMKKIKGGNVAEIHCTANCPPGQTATGMYGDSESMTCSDIKDANGVVIGLRITISGQLTLDHMCSAASEQ